MDLAGLLAGAGQLGAATLPYTLSQGEIENLRQLGTTSQQQAQQIASQAAEASAFQPYSVRFGTSTTQVGPEGITSMLADPLANIQGGLIQQTQQAMGQTTATPEELYGQIRAIQTPEEQRQRLELENRLAAQGRLGVQTAAYGGTPEQLAFEKAIQEAQNQASLQAIEAAPQLQRQQIENITGLLGAAFVPQQQSIAAIAPSLEAARIQQAARQGQTEALYRGGIAGLEAQAAAGTAASNIEAARTQALANALSGMFARPDSGGASSAEQLVSALLGRSSGYLEGMQAIEEAGL